VWWHALGLLRLLWRRSKTWTTLSSASGHDTTEQVAGSMANLGGLRLGGAVLRVLARTATGLDFALELRNPVLVSIQQSVVVWVSQTWGI
jgi:hypothetical protein